MNESKQAMLELADKIDGGVSLKVYGQNAWHLLSVTEMKLIVAALRASAPQEDGRALEPVAWRWHEPGEVRWTLSFYPPNRDEIAREPLYSAPPSVALEAGRAHRETLGMDGTLPERMRMMPSSLNDACRTLEAGAEEIDRLRALIRPQPGGGLTTERNQK